MERDPAAAVIDTFRTATRCGDAVRDANWRAVQARVRAPMPRASVRPWVFAAVAVAAAAAAVWIGSAWLSSAAVLANRGEHEQASDVKTDALPSGQARDVPASLPETGAASLPASPPRAEPPPVVTPARPSEPAIARSVPVPAVVAPPAPVPDTLALEAGAIEQARRAIDTGDLDGATAALDRHAKLYPEGVLADDRWTLRVRVQCERADLPAARAAASAFVRARPDSALARRLAATPCTEPKNP